MASNDQKYTATVFVNSDNGHETAPTNPADDIPINGLNLQKLENEVSRQSGIESAFGAVNFDTLQEALDEGTPTRYKAFRNLEDGVVWTWDETSTIDNVKYKSPTGHTGAGRWKAFFVDENANQVPFSLLRADMHFGILKGIPWKSGETGGIVETTASAVTIVDSMTLPVANSASYSNDQLICYEAADGEWYSAVIKDKSGNILNLRTPIEALISSGGKVSNFYNNNAHPNLNGYKTIVDYALRDLKYSMRKVATINHDEFIAIGSPTLSVSNDENIYAPGSTSNPYLKVSGAEFEGVSNSGLFSLPAGQYFIRGIINPGTSNGGASLHRVQLSFVQTLDGLTAQTVAQQSLDGENCTRQFGFECFVADNSTQKIRVWSRTTGGGDFEVAKVEIFRIENLVANLDSGTHVLFGDSWFAITGIAERLAERLPNATIINEGVGGNKADQLVSRFNADVATKNPDIPWVMCGTNDYFSNVGLNTFEFNMNTLKQKIAGIGASTVFFDASVGEIDNASDPQNFDRSREYALKGSYSQSATQQKPEVSTVKETIFVNQSLAVGEEITIFAASRPTNVGFVINRFRAGGSGTANLVINAGYRGSVGLPSSDIVSFAGNTVIEDSSPNVIPAPATTPRFLSMSAKNNDTQERRITAHFEIEYTPN